MTVLITIVRPSGGRRQRMRVSIDGRYVTSFGAAKTVIVPVTMPSFEITVGGRIGPKGRAAVSDLKDGDVLVYVEQVPWKAIGIAIAGLIVGLVVWKISDLETFGPYRPLTVFVAYVTFAAYFVGQIHGNSITLQKAAPGSVADLVDEARA